MRYLKPDALHPWHSRYLQPSYAGHNRCILTINSSLQQPKRSRIDPPLHLARQKRKSRRCPFLCATHYSDVRNRSANIKHAMKLWLERKKSFTLFLESLRSYKAFAAHFLSQLFPEAAAPAPACKSLLQT